MVLDVWVNIEFWGLTWVRERSRSGDDIVGVKVFFTWVSADFPESAYSSCSLGVNISDQIPINSSKGCSGS